LPYRVLLLLSWHWLQLLQTPLLIARGCSSQSWLLLLCRAKTLLLLLVELRWMAKALLPSGVRRQWLQLLRALQVVLNMRREATPRSKHGVYAWHAHWHGHAWDKGHRGRPMQMHRLPHGWMSWHRWGYAWRHPPMSRRWGEPIRHARRPCF
jgi:hypothetical protein